MDPPGSVRWTTSCSRVRPARATRCSRARQFSNDRDDVVARGLEADVVTSSGVLASPRHLKPELSRLSLAEDTRPKRRASNALRKRPNSCSSRVVLSGGTHEDCSRLHHFRAHGRSARRTGARPGQGWPNSSGATAFRGALPGLVRGRAAGTPTGTDALPRRRAPRTA